MPINVGKLGKPALPNNDLCIQPGRVVDYEQHSKVNLGLVLRDKKSKWVLLNLQGAELEMSPDRLYLFPPDKTPIFESNRDRINYLTSTLSQAETLAANVNFEEIWELVSENKRELSAKELTEIAFNHNTLINHLAMRRALLTDRVYFRRGKIGFDPRSADAVKEMKLQVKADE